MGDVNILDEGCDVVDLRSRIGMVFQKPNPFPKTIYDNVAYGPRIHGMVRNKGETDEVVENALRARRIVERRFPASCTIWPRNCRADSNNDCASPAPLPASRKSFSWTSPCSALDPIATGRIEELMFNLRQDYTIIIVTPLHAAGGAHFAIHRFLSFGRNVGIRADRRCLPASQQ